MTHQAADGRAERMAPAPTEGRVAPPDDNLSAVWKFELAIDDAQRVAMPEGAELLHVAEQYGKVVLWARCPVGGIIRPATRRILIRGTGHPVGSHPYIGTVVTAGGALVWHVFDGGEEALPT